MFKTTKKKHGIILFISSYIPLFIIIIIQNFFSLIDKITIELSNRKLGVLDVITSKVLFKKALIQGFSYIEVYTIIFMLILIFVSYFKLKAMMNTTIEGSGFEVTVKDPQNANNECITNYFAGYILPFITLNLTTIAGLLSFIFLGYIIGYIYIKNELFYINPTLNLKLKYNIYRANMVYQDGEDEIKFEAILLSKKEKHQLKGNKKIKVMKENELLYIEKD